MRKSRGASALKELLIDYAPNKQVVLCKDRELCYFGSSPTLAEINRDYDQLAAIAFLVPQLTNVAEFANCKTSFSEGQLMLFFYKFKAGEFGQFYGSVSPMVIMCSLKSFIRERNDAIFEHESEKRKKEIEENKKSAISYQEYYRDKADSIISFFYNIAKMIHSLTYKYYNNDKD